MFFSNIKIKKTNINLEVVRWLRPPLNNIKIKEALYGKVFLFLHWCVY